MKVIFRRALPLLFAVVLLFVAVKDVSFSEIGTQFRKANYAWIALYCLIVTGIFFLRGKRWQQALLALGHSPTAFRTTVALLAGTVASMVVLGSGELTRCATLQRTDNVPFSHSIGSIVAERVLDLIMLMLVLLLTFMLEWSRMSAYATSLTVSLSTPALVTAFGVFLLGLGLVYGVWRSSSTSQHPFVGKIRSFGRGIWAGFSAVRRLPNPGLFVLLTILIQVVSWLTTYIMLLSVDATRNLSPTAALTVMAVASISGLAVPTQGGIGTFHFFVSRALVLYGITLEQSVLAATFMHAVGFGVGLLLSSVSFLIIPFLVRQKPKEHMTA